ncbi:MAG: CRISPR system precrRNA processing endoribonuclease RAMP protein Cas6 [Elusimicrobiales bacterium]|nr:CRISPR system precrRNA processing endoribonuclease RAMP protein Cas6 [Elusimicrobiales bacterium]
MILGSLKFLRLGFSLTAIDKIFIPRNLKGNMFRGAFGLNFKKLYCQSKDICIDRCMDSNCLYKRIFEPSLPEEIAPSGLKNIPRPFIFTHVADDREIIYPGESFNIGINIFGWATEHYSEFIKTIEEIGKEGIGPLRGRFLIRMIYSIDIENNKKIIYDKNGMVENPIPFGFTNDFKPVSTQFRIILKTPTKIIYDAKPISNPEFYHIFSRLRDRISSISYFHNNIDLEENYIALEEDSKNVKTLNSRWNFVEVKRRSSRTKQLQDLSGIVGYALYDFLTLQRAELFYPWIKIGELVNVGKNSVWGMGEIQSDFNLDLKGREMEV